MATRTTLTPSRRPWVLAPILTVALAWATPARADKVADAEALFNQAKDLRDAGNFERACPLFEDSQRLDPQLGTLINLADCYEKQGKWATAWARYKAAIEIAEKRGDDRIDFVREGRDRVEPKVPKVVITVTNDAEGLTVKRGGVKLSDTMYGVKLTVDPGLVPVTILRGEEVLEEREVEAKEGEVSTLELDLAAIAAAHPPPPDPKPAPVTQPVPVPVTPTEPYDPTHRNVGIIISAVGAAAVLVAGGLEIAALVKKGEANAPDSCVNKFCTQDGLDAASSAKTFAEVGQWLGIGGLVTLAVGATVFFTAPSEPDDEASARLVSGVEVAPWLTPVSIGERDGHAGGLTVGGRF
ncbi:MAG: tetratricopeptide repeat protein [Polyangiaceae bacterium]